MNYTQCPVCGAPIKTVPAGFSQKTGRNYPAFQVCSNYGCGWKPPKAEMPQNAPRPYNPYNQTNSYPTTRPTQFNAPQGNPVPQIDYSQKILALSIRINELATALNVTIQAMKKIKTDVDGLKGVLIDDKNSEAFEFHKGVTDGVEKKIETMAIPTPVNDIPNEEIPVINNESEGTLNDFNEPNF
jgi:hypothetical protein